MVTNSVPDASGQALLWDSVLEGQGITNGVRDEEPRVVVPNHSVIRCLAICEKRLRPTLVA